jgi:hypothetical protein
MSPISTPALLFLATLCLALAPCLAGPPAAAKTVIVTEEPDLNLRSKLNQHAREVILERLKDQHGKVEDRIYGALKRARSFGLLVQIPFAPASEQAAAENVAALKKAMEHRLMSRFREDPTVIFLTLGYSDTVKQDQFALSEARAKFVQKTMREGANVQNVTLPLGLGACPTLGVDEPDRAYAAQVWVILP